MSMGEDHDGGASGRTLQDAPGLWRTDLPQHDLSVSGREVVQQRAGVDHEAPLVKHTHPGEEIIYILEGGLEYRVEDQPTRTCNAGDALTVPPGASARRRMSAAARPSSHVSSRRGSRSSRWPGERRRHG